MLTTELYSRYSRHLLLDNFDEEAQLQLMQSKVMLFGCGGLGCQVAMALVSAGVGEIVLVDHDTVELSNLPRQWLFTEADAGQKKVYAARSRLAAMHGGCQIRCIDDPADPVRLATHLPDCSLLLDCTDSVSSRKFVNGLALEHKLPLISASAAGFSATALALNPASGSACYECMEQIGEHSQTCMEQGIFSPVVAIAGQFQASLALSYLCGIQPVDFGQLHVYDGRALTLRHFRVNKNPACPACSNNIGEHHEHIV